MSDRMEYVFPIEDLKNLLDNAPENHNRFCISIAYENKSSPDRVFNVTIKGTTGVAGIAEETIGPAIFGCPDPPGCP